MDPVLARAKVNLSIEVIRRRDDGFHEVVTILQQIDLADRLTFTDNDIVTIECDDPTVRADSNLAFRAARALQSATGTTRGVAIRLEKSIPVAAGLGGGSADAAVTLVALDEFWDLHLGADALCRLARELGSDVPFFLRGGTQIGTGRGDDLEALPTPAAWIVLATVRSSFVDKTKLLYASLQPVDLSDGRRVRAVAAALEHGSPLPLDFLVNAFERSALDLYDEIQPVFRAFHLLGVRPMLCGAGPTVMSIHDDETTARQLSDRLRMAGHSTQVVTTVSATSHLNPS